MKRLIATLGLALVLLTGCTSEPTTITPSGEGVYGDYVVISIDDYMDLLMELTELETMLRWTDYNCLDELDLAVVDCGDYYLVLCETCDKYAIVYKLEE